MNPESRHSNRCIDLGTLQTLVIYHEMAEEKEEERVPELHIRGIYIDVPEEVAKELPDGARAMGCQIHWEGDIMTMATMLIGAAMKEPHIRMTLETVVDYLRHTAPMSSKELRDQAIKKMTDDMLEDAPEELKKMFGDILKGGVKTQGDA